MTGRANSGKDAAGRWGEAIAAQYLIERGLRVLAQNWRCRLGELDLVALDADCVVFVEVKTRSGLGFGHPAEAVNAAKRARLRRLAAVFMAERRWAERLQRFDIVAVIGTAPGPWQCEWIRDAFGG